MNLNIKPVYCRWNSSCFIREKAWIGQYFWKLNKPLQKMRFTEELLTEKTAISCSKMCTLTSRNVCSHTLSKWQDFNFKIRSIVDHSHSTQVVYKLMRWASIIKVQTFFCLHSLIREYHKTNPPGRIERHEKYSPIYK